MTKRSSRRGSRRPRSNPKPKVTFGLMNRGQPGDDTWLTIEVDGKDFGQITGMADTEWVGMSRRYVTGSYNVEIYGFENEALNVDSKLFDVAKGERPTATLGRAKQYVRDYIEAHAGAK